MGEVVVNCHVMALLLGQRHQAVVNFQCVQSVLRPLLIHLINQALFIGSQG